MNDLFSLVDWSRAQFALTAIYHWLFVPLKRMVINLLKLVLGRVGVLLRGVVGAVIESLGIGRPPCAREFHPLDLVGSERLVGGVHHADLSFPVRKS